MIFVNSQETEASLLIPRDICTNPVMPASTLPCRVMRLWVIAQDSVHFRTTVTSIPATLFPCLWNRDWKAISV